MASPLLPIVTDPAGSPSAGSACTGSGSGSGSGSCSSVGTTAAGNVVSRYLDNLGERQPHGPLAKMPLPMSM
ncbi:MAG: hypothetical protein ACK6DC_01790, partial [Planctomycetota bacterium]